LAAALAGACSCARALRAFKRLADTAAVATKARREIFFMSAFPGSATSPDLGGNQRREGIAFSTSRTQQDGRGKALSLKS
jgi:hypothetical protein